MKRTIITSILLSISFISFSQIDSLQKEINEQVWKPFVSAYNNRDNDALSKVHSKELIRIAQDEKVILGYAEYFRKVPDSIKARRSNWQFSIELRFAQRIASAGKAFEVGYFKLIRKNTQTGDNSISFGKFHVLLRKEEGVWKILMDADSSVQADEKSFLAASPLE